MDYTITTDDQGRGVILDAAGGDLFNNVYLSLEIPQGSWWFDTNFGLRKRTRMKNTAATADLLKQDIEAALQWLIDNSRATSIVVTMIRDIPANRHRIQGHVLVTAASGSIVTYDKFIEVV